MPSTWWTAHSQRAVTTLRSEAAHSGARSHIAGGVSVSNAAACLAWAEQAIELGAHEDSEWWMPGRARSWCLVRGGRPPEPAEGEPDVEAPHLAR